MSPKRENECEIIADFNNDNNVIHSSIQILVNGNEYVWQDLQKSLVEFLDMNYTSSKYGLQKCKSKKADGRSRLMHTVGENLLPRFVQ